MSYPTAVGPSSPTIDDHEPVYLNTDLDWRELGACWDSDSDAFIPFALALEERGMFLNHYVTAIRVCSECSVQEKCLDFAVKTRQDFGVWGGKTPKQRLQLRRTRRGGRQGFPPSPS